MKYMKRRRRRSIATVRTRHRKSAGPGSTASTMLTNARTPQALATVLVGILLSAGDCGPSVVTPLPPVLAATVGPDLTLLVGDSRGVVASRFSDGQPDGSTTIDVDTWATLEPAIATVLRSSFRAATVTGVGLGTTQVDAVFASGLKPSESADRSTVQVVRVEACGQNFDIIREIDLSLGVFGFCLNSLDASGLHSGLINHSLAGVLPIPSIMQTGDHLDFSHVGGAVLAQTPIGTVATAIPGIAAPIPSVVGQVSASVFAGAEFVHVPGALNPASDPSRSSLLVWGRTKDVIPHAPDKYVEYSMVLDADRSAANNAVLPPGFEGDWAQGGDFVYQLLYSPTAGEWTLRALDISNTTASPTAPVEVQTAAQGFFTGSTVMLAIPWDDPLAPLVRWTAFGHSGDFGTQAPFSFYGDYHPEPGQPLEDLQNIAGN